MPALLLLIFILSSVATLVVTPIIVIAVAMSFDAPGATWRLYHLPVIALPLILAAISMSSGVALCTSSTVRLGPIFLWLLADLALLATMWIVA